MSTMHDNMVKEVNAVLTEKRHARVPVTIQKALTELFHAEKFSGETAQKRANDKVEFIRSALKKLSTREFNTSPMALSETQLERDAYEKRLLIHASLVNELALTRKAMNERITALEARIEGSLSKVPFSQLDEFRRDLVELQAVESLPEVTED